MLIWALQNALMATGFAFILDFHSGSHEPEIELGEQRPNREHASSDTHSIPVIEYKRPNETCLYDQNRPSDLNTDWSTHWYTLLRRSSGTRGICSRQWQRLSFDWLSPGNVHSCVQYQKRKRLQSTVAQYDYLYKAHFNHFSLRDIRHEGEGNWQLA